MKNLLKLLNPHRTSRAPISCWIVVLLGLLPAAVAAKSIEPLHTLSWSKTIFHCCYPEALDNYDADGYGHTEINYGEPDVGTITARSRAYGSPGYVVNGLLQNTVTLASEASWTPSGRDLGYAPQTIANVSYDIGLRQTGAVAIPTNTFSIPVTVTGTLKATGTTPAVTGLNYYDTVRVMASATVYYWTMYTSMYKETQEFWADGKFGTTSAGGTRGFSIEGTLKVTDGDPPDKAYITIVLDTSVGVAGSHSLTGSAFADPVIQFDQAAFDLAQAAQGEPTFNLTNAFELVFSEGTIPQPTLMFDWTGSQLVLSWEDTNAVLEASEDLNGAWTELTGAESPTVVPTESPQKFFRLRKP